MPAKLTMKTLKALHRQQQEQPTDPRPRRATIRVATKKRRPRRAVLKVAKQRRPRRKS